MPSSSCHLPNGQTFQVTRVFGGVSFRSNDMNLHHSAFPPGWTIVIYTQHDSKKPDHDATGDSKGPSTTPKEPDDEREGGAGGEEAQDDSDSEDDASSNTSRFTRPTLRNDCLYISYIVNPPSTEFKPPSSPSRQIAMMLWATLWWYFHEPEPDLHITTPASSKTPIAARPKGEWRVNIKREGIFKGRNLLQKLERMGLVASEDSWVGLDPVSDAAEWSNMFVSRRSFWQLDPRIFLFTLSPKFPLSQSPSREVASMGPGESTLYHATGGPFTSGSHLPTYFPPPPTQYTFTDGIRHPIRPKPPRQGQVFYIRYIPSVDQYLSFRIPYLHPRTSSSSSSSSTTTTTTTTTPSAPPSSSSTSQNTPTATTTPTHTPTTSLTNIEQRLFPALPSDLQTLHKWMNDPRVDATWGESGPQSSQEDFLRRNLTDRHSFPVIGCWNGRPFGYFEIYWAKEDRLGRALGGGNVGDYDRGVHVLVGEEEYRGPQRVPIWLSALVHFCWLADLRTECVFLEPRVDNVKMINYLQSVGFYKEGEISFPHKQSALMKIKREFWEAPVL